MKKDKVFITGMPRSGTTLLLLIMEYFEKCRVFTSEEMPPIQFSKGTPIAGRDIKYAVIKQPFGYFEAFPPEYNYGDLLNLGYKIISMIRDPRDILTSIHRANKDTYWVSPNIIKRCAKEHLKHLNNTEVLPIRYEDLVSNPEKELKRISNFLGCNLSSKYKNFYKNPLATGWISLNGPREISTDKINRWKQEKYKERIKEIMDEDMKEIIKKLGYGE